MTESPDPTDSLQGVFNNQRHVCPSVSFNWSSKWGGDEVFVTGDFSSWAVSKVPVSWKGWLERLPMPAREDFGVDTHPVVCGQELIPLRQNPISHDFHLSCSLPVSPFSSSPSCCSQSEKFALKVQPCCIDVQPGTYSYQFLVDGTWMTSPDVPVSPDEDGHPCNKV